MALYEEWDTMLMSNKFEINNRSTQTEGAGQIRQILAKNMRKQDRSGKKIGRQYKSEQHNVRRRDICTVHAVSSQ